MVFPLCPPRTVLDTVLDRTLSLSDRTRAVQGWTVQGRTGQGRYKVSVVSYGQIVNEFVP